MSLINDMLRDLDSRNAASSERNGLANNIRALPSESAQRSISPLLLILAAATAGGAAVWFYLRPPAVPAPTTVAVAPVATPPAAAPTAPPAADPVPAVQETVAPAAALPVPIADAPAMRLETGISQPPEKPAVKAEPAKKSEPAPKTDVDAPRAKPVAAAAPAPANLYSAEAARSNAAPQISKQPTDASTSNERADAEYRRGVAALRRGDAVEGGEALRAALRISPTHAPARQGLLALFTEQQRWNEAETLALDGVGLLPQRSDWALLAARLMYERGDAANALTVLDQYAGNARQNADYQVLRALLLMRAGRNGDAAECYQTALTLRPNEGRWWYGLGRALDADHREALARQAYEKARDSGNLPPDLQQAVDRRLRQS